MVAEDLIGFIGFIGECICGWSDDISGDDGGVLVNFLKLLLLLLISLGETKHVIGSCSPVLLSGLEQTRLRLTTTIGEYRLDVLSVEARGCLMLDNVEGLRGVGDDRGDDGDIDFELPPSPLPLRHPAGFVAIETKGVVRLLGLGLDFGDRTISGGIKWSGTSTTIRSLLW